MSKIQQPHKKADLNPSLLEMFKLAARDHICLFRIHSDNLLTLKCPLLYITDITLRSVCLLASSTFAYFLKNGLINRNDNLPGLCFEKMSQVKE